VSNYPDISIITPTFNRAQVLKRAIDSVLTQTFENFEYLIIDDHSTDTTAELLASYRDPRIRRFRLSEWQGANAARNLGIQYAQADWITFLDSDDAYFPQRLENVWDRIRTQPAVPHFLSSFQVHLPEKVVFCRNPEKLLDGHELEELLMRYLLVIAGSSITARRSLLQQVEGFTPSIRRLQDRELALKLSRICHTQLLHEIDWQKYPSPDSISEQPDGYLEAFNALLETHPELSVRYRGVIGFRVFRMMRAAVRQGRFSEAYKIFRDQACLSQLGFSLGEMVSRYRNERAAHRATVIKFESWFPDAELDSKIDVRKAA